MRIDREPERDTVGLEKKTNAILVGIDGVAPYWFELEAALFLSDRGDLTARTEAAYDLRLTQRLLRRGQADELLERMELENGHFSERLTSDEVKEAITAFFAKRAAPVT